MTSGPFGRLDMVFPQFDPAQGELTDIRWDYSSGVFGVFAFDNELPAPLAARFDLGARIGFGAPFGSFRDADAGQLLTLNLGSDDEPGLPPDFLGPDSARRSVPGAAFASDGINPRFFPGYLGDGTVTLFVVAGPLGPPPIPGLAVLAVEPFTVGASASLTYTFTPAAAVPEPSTLALVGLTVLAGAGVGLQRYRRRRA